MRNRLGLGEARIVLYTGTFETIQGFELLVDATKSVTEKAPDVRFVLVGGTPEQIERLRRHPAPV